MRTSYYEGAPFLILAQKIRNRLSAIRTTPRTWVNFANLVFALPV